MVLPLAVIMNQNTTYKLHTEPIKITKVLFNAKMLILYTFQYIIKLRPEGHQNPTTNPKYVAAQKCRVLPDTVNSKLKRIFWSHKQPTPTNDELKSVLTINPRGDK